MPPNKQRRPGGSGAAASFAAGELPQHNGSLADFNGARAGDDVANGLINGATTLAYNALPEIMTKVTMSSVELVDAAP